MKINQFDLYYRIINRYKVFLLVLFFLCLFNPIRVLLIPRIITQLSMKNINSKLFNFILIFLIVYIGIIFYEYFLVKFIKVYFKEDILNYFYKKIFDGLENNYSELPSPEIFTNVFYFGTSGSNMFSYFFNTVFPYILILFIVGIYFIYLGDYLIGISFILINLFILLVPLFYSKDIRKDTHRYTNYRNKSEKNIFDIFWNIYNIFSNNQQKYERKNIEVMVSNLRNLGEKKWTNAYIKIAISRIITIFIFFLIVYYYYRKLINKQIKFSLFINIILILCFICYETFWAYYIFYGIIIEYYEQERVLKEINKTIEQVNNKSNSKLYKSNSNGLSLEILDLHFTYFNNNNIFNGLDLVFKNNKSYALTGSIGSGKSSLLKLIFGIYKPIKGDIIINGKIHRNNTENPEWRKYFNYLQQSPILFGRSIQHNIEYGNNSKIVKKKINEYGINKIINKIKKERSGQILGKLGEGVSGGQKQIINMVRIISSKKPIILMDEPTSSLDPKSKELFYRIFNNLCKKNKIIIVATHDEELVKLCDEKIVLDKGSLIKKLII